MRILLCFLLTSAAASAQTDSLSPRFQLDAFYGYAWGYNPGFLTFHHPAQNSRYSVIGPAGARGECKLIRRIGAGIELSFLEARHRYDVWDDDEGTTESYSVVVSEFRAVPFFNVYVVQQPEFELFVSLGGGYRRVFLDAPPSFGSSIYSLLSAIPVGVRLGAGMRFYFTDRIGVHAAGGLEQGGTIGGGITWKW